MDFASTSVYSRLEKSFGAWNMLASMLDAEDFLRLQALNRFAYRVSISRAQPRWRLVNLRALVRSNVVQGLFMCDKRGQWTRAEECGLDSSIMTATVLFR